MLLLQNISVSSMLTISIQLKTPLRVIKTSRILG